MKKENRVSNDTRYLIFDEIKWKKDSGWLSTIYLFYLFQINNLIK